MTRVLVCGGRAFADVPRLWKILDYVDKQRDIRCVIDGAQEQKTATDETVGADYWGHQWALARNKPIERYEANWYPDGKTLDRSAGPRRNQRMIDEGKPDLVIAMPGGRGTLDMVKRARKAGVKVREFGPPVITAGPEDLPSTERVAAASSSLPEAERTAEAYPSTGSAENG